MPVSGTGAYNLNWIDDQNEYQAIISAEEFLARGECPIQGMSKQTFEAILSEQEYETIKDQYGVKNRFMK